MTGMDGVKVGVAATRKAGAISTLVQKNGGTPVVYSIQGEQQLNENICEQNVEAFLEKPFDMVLLTTGVGIEILEATALDLNRHSEFIQKMGETNLAVRGRKTLNWAKKHSLSVQVISDDGTMGSLLANLDVERPNRGNRIFLQAYNQDDAEIKKELENIGYSIYLSKPYHYKVPDHKTLRSLREEIIAQTLHTVIFTSKTQVQNLFNKYERPEEIVESLNKRVLAAAIGKVTAQELEQRGVSKVFQSSTSKMGAMVVELTEYFKQKSNRV
ncbi:uroporphyrinogen-III synthase [Virgibacillus sp. L01]|uniref:uroporphyrinogen-III synthase n=1 Tax=Virgibacillus sp. L01 TaxID=3457429 RepID=UPI003FCFBEF3